MMDVSAMAYKEHGDLNLDLSGMRVCVTLPINPLRSLEMHAKESRMNSRGGKRGISIGASRSAAMAEALTRIPKEIIQNLY